MHGSPERVCVYACPLNMSVLWRVCVYTKTAGEERGAGSRRRVRFTQVEAEESETTGGFLR